MFILRVCERTHLHRQFIFIMDEVLASRFTDVAEDGIPVLDPSANQAIRSAFTTSAGYLTEILTQIVESRSASFA